MVGLSCVFGLMESKEEENDQKKTHRFDFDKDPLN